MAQRSLYTKELPRRTKKILVCWAQEQFALLKTTPKAQAA
jgi:hypothetical protein